MAEFDVHLHFNKICTGHTEVTSRSFEAHMTADQVFPSSETTRTYYVCFIPRTAEVRTANPLGPRSRLEQTLPTPDRELPTPDRDLPAPNWGVPAPENNVERDFGNRVRNQVSGGAPSYQTQILRSPRLTIETGIKRPGSPSSETHAHHKHRGTIVRTVPRQFTASATSIAGDSGIQLILSHIKLDHSAERLLPSVADEGTDGGSAHRPLLISSRDTTPAFEGNAPETNYKRKSSPVDDHKALYEFLLSKKPPNMNRFIVGSIKASAMPQDYKGTVNGKTNAVVVGLEKRRAGGYYVTHRTIGQDTDGNPLPKLSGNRIGRESFEYFEQLQALQDKASMKAFLVEHYKSLVRGEPYELASIVDLGDGDEGTGDDGDERTEEEEEDTEEENDSSTRSVRPRKIVTIRLPPHMLATVERSSRYV